MELEPGEERGALAQTLIRLRRGRRLSQRRLAKLSGVSLATIRDIELGNQKNPRPDTLRLLARGVVTPDDGDPKLEEFWAAYTELMRTAGYSREVEEGPLYHGRIAREGFKVFGTLPGPIGEHSRFVDYLLTRVAEALVRTSAEDKIFIETQLLLLVERFAPLHPVDVTEPYVDDDALYPRPDIYLRRLMDKAREPFDANTPSVEEENLYDAFERQERHTARPAPSADASTTSDDTPDSSPPTGG